MTSTSAHPFAGFGANEWLVDEMYQQYLKDPSSVDKAWWDFFADYSPPEKPRPDGAAAEAAEATEAGAPATRALPKPPGPARPSTPPGPAVKAQPSGAAGRAPAAASADSSVAADAQPAADEIAQLRGAAARTVTNMEASLTLPTATSVRDVPAKLLADNRLVMNNHLKRGRGGKISFTHVLGFAIVKAAQALPEMNVAYTEVNGKPGIVHHRDVNLGLAIDMTKDDGTRQLLVPSIKGAQNLDFAQFWSAYEEVVRRARAGKLTADDFAGTTITLT
ncbi:MAG: 2-oxo acid dehydrogenase subunit E2, partial [Trebonia sp.]